MITVFFKEENNILNVNTQNQIEKYWQTLWPWENYVVAFSYLKLFSHLEWWWWSYNKTQSLFIHFLIMSSNMKSNWIVFLQIWMIYVMLWSMNAPIWNVKYIQFFCLNVLQNNIINTSTMFADDKWFNKNSVSFSFLFVETNIWLLWFDWISIQLMSVFSTGYIISTKLFALGFFLLFFGIVFVLCMQKIFPFSEVFFFG